MSNVVRLSLGLAMGVLPPVAAFWSLSEAGALSLVTLAGTGAFTLVWIVALVGRLVHRAPEKVLLLGQGPLVARVCEEVGAAGGGHRIIGIVDDVPTAERMNGPAPWLGTVEQFAKAVDNSRPARVVLTMADRRGRVPEQALLQARLRGVRVEEGLDFYERVAGKVAIEWLRPSALILSDGFRRLDLSRRGLWWRCSRAVEGVVSLLCLILLSPIFAIVALLIKLDSPGSVFFVQSRVGCGGRPFGLYKFRTMREVADVRSEWVRDNTDRVTRVGKWLRRFRIDEWPQFWNVLRGDMSFVGPRPHPVSNYRKFMQEIPYYHLRELVRPGITGWAQIRQGYANDLEEETEKMRYDLYYIKHRSLWLDLRILVQTVTLLVFDRQSHQATKPKPAVGGPVLGERS